jgi:CDP-glucose 4,6-dehydratase
MNFRSTFEGQRVFLTGHTGFKGAWLSEWLLGLGARLTGFSIDVPKKPSLFEELRLYERMKDIRGDVRSLESVKGALEESQAAVVFHLAAQPLVRASYDDPVGTFDTNVMGTANVLEACRHSRSVKAVVVVTTDKVYENENQGKAFRETDPLGGHDPYSASKAGAEIVFSSYVRSFFGASEVRVASARAGNVIGGGDWAADRLVPDCMRYWADGAKVPVRNPDSVRPWQHVLEPLAGYLLLAQRLLESQRGIAGEAFNFGPEKELTRSALELVAEMEKRWTGAGHEVRALSDHKKEAALLSLDATKARRLLGWAPKLDFPATASWTVDWYRSRLAHGDVASLTRKQIEAFQEL